MTEWERLLTEVEDALEGVESLSVQEIATNLGRDPDVVLNALAGLLWLGRVAEFDCGGEIHYGLPSPEEPEPPWEPPKPKTPVRRAPVLRHKTFVAQVQDGDI